MLAVLSVNNIKGTTDSFDSGSPFTNEFVFHINFNVFE